MEEKKFREGMWFECTFCDHPNEINQTESIGGHNGFYTKIKCMSCRNWFEVGITGKNQEHAQQSDGFLDLDDDGELWGEEPWDNYVKTQPQLEESWDKIKHLASPKPSPSVISEEKPPLHLILQLRDFVALSMMAFYEGGMRPGRTVLGWLKSGETKEKVLGGLLRHLTALEAGERRDPKSNEDHLANFACNAIMYVVLTLRGLWK